MTPDGFGEGDDEAQEVLAGIGVDEVAYVVGGLDSFGGGLEVERGSDCGKKILIFSSLNSSAVDLVFHEVHSL